MARSYHLAAAAAALGAGEKWLDNLLSHHAVAGVTRARRGVSRRISAEALLRIDIARQLASALSLPMPRALALAERLELAGGRLSEGGVMLEVDIDRTTNALAERLVEAAEMAPPRRRGRPPAGKRR